MGLLLRIWQLDNHPLHHDESMHAFYGLKITTQGVYQYTPFLHGPLLYYLAGVNFWIFHASDTVTRLAPALVDSMLCFFPLLFS